MSSSQRPFSELADMVRQARLRRRMSQRRLSSALGMSEGYVGHLEGGRTRPTVGTLKAIASVLALPYGRLALAAGYITSEEYDNPLDESQLARLNEVNDLTDEEWESVRDFARYIRSRRHEENGP
ncbi:MAG: helix-turn-helix domain-containing protein [Chloroflexi bacterium]|nr:helix-turn-helix domain-containing protein [Chloroflexota bacterium]